jgi:hypothetical protein
LTLMLIRVVQQEELADFLRPAPVTKAKVLLTPRRDEQARPGDMTGCCQLPAMAIPDGQGGEKAISLPSLHRGVGEAIE